MSDGEFQMYSTADQIESEFARSMQVKTQPMTGTEKIAQERLEQKVKHGYGVKGDVQNNSNNELADAAVALITQDVNKMPEEWDQTICNYMLRKTYEERLIIAGALIAAEIDRLNYKE
jgi:hypothetical protein